MRPVIAAITVSIIALAFSIVGCDTDPVHDEPLPSYREFGRADTAAVYEGEEFEIVLYNNSNDAGYSWYITEEFDHDIVEFVKKYSVTVNPNLLGSPIYEHWRYFAASQGTTTARYKLYRLWMGEGDAIDSAYVTVFVD
jgi:predicted secreted protein